MGDEEIKSWVSIDESSVSKVDEKMVELLDKLIGEALERFQTQMENRLQAASQRATFGGNDAGPIFDRRMNMMMRYEARSFLRAAATGVIASEFGDQLTGATDSFLGRSVGNSIMATALSGPTAGIESLLFSVVREAIRLQAEYKKEQEEMRKETERLQQKVRDALSRLEDEAVKRQYDREERELERLQSIRKWAQDEGYDMYLLPINGQIAGASE